MYSGTSRSKIDGLPTGAWHCSFADSKTQIDSSKEKFSTGATDSAANPSNFVGMASPTGMESGFTPEALSVANTQAENETSDGSVSSATSS